MAVGAKRKCSRWFSAARSQRLSVGLGVVIGIPIVLVGARVNCPTIVCLTGECSRRLGTGALVLIAAAGVADLIVARHAMSTDQINALRVE